MKGERVFIRCALQSLRMQRMLIEKLIRPDRMVQDPLFQIWNFNRHAVWSLGGFAKRNSQEEKERDEFRDDLEAWEARLANGELRESKQRR